MVKRNLKKIGVGFILISFAVIVTITAFYYAEVKPELAKRRQKDTVINPPAKKIPKEQKEIPKMENTQTESVSQEDAIHLSSLIQEAKKLYDETEQKRTEGFLWVDRKSEKFVVTLGAIHGLKTGSVLKVYDGNSHIGQVKVELPLDSISYVQPLNESTNLVNGDYFRVVIE